MFEYGSGYFLAFLLGIVDLTLIFVELTSVRASNFSKINFLFDMHANTYVESSRKTSGSTSWFLVKKLFLFPLLSWVWVAIYVALYIQQKRNLSIVPDHMKVHLFKVSTFHLSPEEMKHIYKKDLEDYGSPNESMYFDSPIRQSQTTASYTYSPTNDDNKNSSFLKSYFLFCGWFTMAVTGPILIIMTILSSGNDLPAIWTIPFGIVTIFWGYSIVFGVKKNNANIFVNAITIMWVGLFVALINLISEPVLPSFIRLFIASLQMVGLYKLKKNLFPKLL